MSICVGHQHVVGSTVCHSIPMSLRYVTEYVVVLFAIPYLCHCGKGRDRSGASERGCSGRSDKPSADT